MAERATPAEADASAVPSRAVPPHLDRSDRRRNLLRGKAKLHIVLASVGFFSVVGLAVFATNEDKKGTPTAAQRGQFFATGIRGGAEGGHVITADITEEGDSEPLKSTSRRLARQRRTRLKLRASPNGSEVDVEIEASKTKGQPETWCFYDALDYRFTVDNLPSELCSVVVFCCFGLSKDGVVPKEQDRLSVLSEQRKSKPSCRIFLGVASGGDTSGFESLAAKADDNATVYRMCRSLVQRASKLGFQGVLFQPPDGTHPNFHKFLLKLYGCLASFDVEVTAVLTEEAVEDPKFVAYKDYLKHFQNVVLAPHRAGSGNVTCPYDRDALPWLRWPEGGSAAARKKLIFSVSLAPLRYRSRSLHGPWAPTCFGRQAMGTPRRVPYAQLCPKLQDFAKEEPQPISGCHVYRDGEHCYLFLSSKALGIMEEARQKFSHGVAVVDLNFDDYAGVCGEKYRVFNALLNMLGNAE